MDSRNENYEVQRRNAISLPLFSKKRNNKRKRKLWHSSRCDKKDRTTVACKKFTRTMDDCKRYLKELHDSNKNLGLICSSSDLSDGASVKNFCSDTQVGEIEKSVHVPKVRKTYYATGKIIASVPLQQQWCAKRKHLSDINNDGKETEVNEDNKEENVEETMNIADRKQSSKDRSLELSSAIYPVLKLIDKRLLPSNMNITFSSDVFSPRSTSNPLIPKSCQRKKFLETSQEALYQVKRKLESLHNVLRMYELQNGGANAFEEQRENNNKTSNVCKNSMDILVPATTMAGNWNKGRKSRVNFIDAKGSYREIQGTASNSSEQYESDETARSSLVSVRNYSNVFNTCRANNMNDSDNSFGRMAEFDMSNDHELELIRSNRFVHLSSVKYEKIPERVYYALSSDSSECAGINKRTTVPPDLYVEGNQTKSLCFSEQYPAPMETDEDPIVSPTSSRTEMSKDSELEDKSTALLLQEALQFKQALLTRVELENVYYIDQNTGEMNNEPARDREKYSYVSNNLQSKILDIISEEQSVSSSTEKTSRTYMFFNVKQEKQFNNIYNFARPNEADENVDLNEQRDCTDSKQNLASPSEYFSFSNIIQEEIGVNNQLSLSMKSNHLRAGEPAEANPGGLQLKYLNDTLDKSDENLPEFSSCLNAAESSLKERDTCYDYLPMKKSFEEHFTRMNSINEFIYRSIHSVELFSQNLDEPVSTEEAGDSNRNNASNFVNCESMEVYTDMKYNGNTDDLLDKQLNASDNDKYVDDREISTGSPNLTLKRNPGACSLIEQTQAANLEQTNEMQDMIENEIGVYGLTPCGSKETSSFEVNLMQASLASSVNNSNDLNVPGCATVPSNKSLDGEKLDLNWSNVRNDFSDDCEHEAKTLSANTITLQQYNEENTNDYVDTDCIYNEDEKLREENKNSVLKNSYTELDNQGHVNEVECYKSYCNLISARSSMYFTDEASSSVTKLNNPYATSLEGFSRLKLHKQHEVEDKACNKTAKTRNIENTEVQSVPNEETSAATTTPSPDINLINEFDNRQSIVEPNSNARNNQESFPLKSCTENTNISPRNEIYSPKDAYDISENSTKALYNRANDWNLLSADNVATDRGRFNSQANKSEKLNMEQCIIWSSMSPRQYAPKDPKENKTTKRTSATAKSCASRCDKLKKQNCQQAKDFKLDTSNAAQSKRDGNRKPTRTRSRDLSAECSRRDNGGNIQLDRKRSRSEISFRRNDVNSESCSQSPDAKSKLKGLAPTPKTSSRSCIPVLKSRLEAARKTENESRPRSPMRGPLTMTMFCRDDLCEKNHDVEDIQVEGKLKSDEVFMKDTNDYAVMANHNCKRDSLKMFHKNLGEPSGITRQEQMVIYVNIFTKYDRNATKIVDPTKFLEYIRNRNASLQTVGKNRTRGKDFDFGCVSAENENNGVHDVVTVVSSVINGNELNQTTSMNASASNTKHDSLANILLNGKLNNLCFLSVEQREIDVTAKPSVIDTSTSISDLETISGQSVMNKFQICGTPRELNNEEYVALLEILYQEANFVHLQELQNACTKLVSGH